MQTFLKLILFSTLYSTLLVSYVRASPADAATAVTPASCELFIYDSPASDTGRCTTAKGKDVFNIYSSVDDSFVAISGGVQLALLNFSSLAAPAPFTFSSDNNMFFLFAPSSSDLSKSKILSPNPKLAFGNGNGDGQLSLVDSVAGLSPSFSDDRTSFTIGSDQTQSYYLVNAPISNNCPNIGEFPIFKSVTGSEVTCSQGPFEIVDIVGNALSSQSPAVIAKFEAASSTPKQFNAAPDFLTFPGDRYTTLTLDKTENHFNFFSNQISLQAIGDDLNAPAFQPDNTVILSHGNASKQVKLVAPAAVDSSKNPDCKGTLHIFSTSGVICSKGTDPVVIYLTGAFFFIAIDGTKLYLANAGQSDPPAQFVLGSNGFTLTSKLGTDDYTLGFAKDGASLSLMKTSDIDTSGFITANIIVRPDSTYFIQNSLTGQYVGSDLNLGIGQAFEFTASPPSS